MNFDFDKMTPIKQQGEFKRITRYWPGKASERKEGDTVVGKYLEKFTFNKDTAKESTVYKLENNGEVIGVASSASIDRQMENIPVGAVVGVRYNGKKQTKSGVFFNDFDVRVDRTSLEVAETIEAGEQIVLDGEDW